MFAQLEKENQRHGKDDPKGKIAEAPVHKPTLDPTRNPLNPAKVQTVTVPKTFAMNVSQIHDEDDKPIELDIKLDQTAA